MNEEPFKSDFYTVELMTAHRFVLNAATPKGIIVTERNKPAKQVRMKGYIQVVGLP